MDLNLIIATLLQDSTITTLTSHVYPMESPHVDDLSTLLPALVWGVTSFDPVMSLDGPTNLAVYGFQVDVFAKKFGQVQGLVVAVTTLLSGYSGDNIAQITITSTDWIQDPLGYHCLVSAKAKYFS